MILVLYGVFRYEHGYFRSPGRGGKNQKIACLFLLANESKNSKDDTSIYANIEIGISGSFHFYLTNTK